MSVRWPSPIDHVYILCNPEKEPERAAYLHKWLIENNIHPDCYTFTCATYGDTLGVDIAWKYYDPWQIRSYKQSPHMYTRNSQTSFNLKRGEISLCINWGTAAQQAIDANHTIVMFWESDVLFEPDFMSKLSESMSELQKHHNTNWDFLSITAGANLRPNRPDHEKFLKWFPVENYFHTRTTDAMIFKVDFLKTMLPTFFPIAEVLDWELNYHLSKHRSRSFWLDPPLISQGSGSGVYKTTL